MRSEALRLVGADCNHVDEFMAECPKGGAVKLFSLALELAWRLGNVFCRNAHDCKRENVSQSRGSPDARPLFEPGRSASASTALRRRSS